MWDPSSPRRAVGWLPIGGGAAGVAVAVAPMAVAVVVVVQMPGAGGVEVWVMAVAWNGGVERLGEKLTRGQREINNKMQSHTRGNKK